MKSTKKFYCGNIEIAVKYLEFMGFNGISTRIVIEITKKDSGEFLDSLFVDFNSEEVRNISCIPPEICDSAIKSLNGYIDKCEEVVTI